MWWTAAKIGVQPADLDRQCKHYVRNTPFFQKLFKHYGVDPKDVWQIRFRSEPMKDSFAATRGNDIFLNEDTISSLGLEKCMHLVVHELTHWLKAHKEKDTPYLADPEEVNAFDWSIAHELAKGVSWDKIEDIFLPLVRIHIKDEAASKMYLIKRFRSASKLLHGS
jgi:hypothetical protein